MSLAPNITSLKPPSWFFTYSITLSDTDSHALNEIDLGYFTTAASDEAGSDRVLLEATIRHADASAASAIRVGSSYGQAYTLLPGSEITLAVQKLSQLYVDNQDGSNNATLEVVLVAANP
ncbi:MAG: hypothetical protein K8I82_04590 [Anaerolineae bacterium]|nr:hypothetical protein [Anaerolineae bacterium]